MSERVVNNRNTGRLRRITYDRETILAVAVELFNEHGYEATSIDALSRRLNLTKSALYHHYSGKEELLKIAIERALDGLEGVFAEEGARVGSARDRLEYVMHSAVQRLVRDMPFVTLLLRLRGNTELERRALQRRKALDNHLAELVQAAKDEGSLREDIDARTTARILFGILNSLVEWYRPSGILSAEQLADQVVAVAFKGIGAPES